MAIREYECRACRIKIDSIEYGHPECHRCPDCQGLMELVEWSVPAKIRVGKYGKAGGLPPGKERGNEET